MDKRAELTWEQIIMILLALIFLVWFLFFSGSVSDVMKDAVRSLGRLFHR
jgi:hypothetical protein